MCGGLLHSHRKPIHLPSMSYASPQALPAFQHIFLCTPCREHKFCTQISSPTFSLWENLVCPSKPYSDVSSSSHSWDTLALLSTPHSPIYEVPGSYLSQHAWYWLLYVCMSVLSLLFPAWGLAQCLASSQSRVPRLGMCV